MLERLRRDSSKLADALGGSHAVNFETSYRGQNITSLDGKYVFFLSLCTPMICNFSTNDEANDLSAVTNSTPAAVKL